MHGIENTEQSKVVITNKTVDFSCLELLQEGVFTRELNSAYEMSVSSRTHDVIMFGILSRSHKNNPLTNDWHVINCVVDIHSGKWQPYECNFDYGLKIKNILGQFQRQLLRCM